MILTKESTEHQDGSYWHLLRIYDLVPHIVILFQPFSDDFLDGVKSDRGVTGILGTNVDVKQRVLELA